MLLQLHKASQFCALDHRTCISSKILISQNYYGTKKKNTVNSWCLPHGLKSKAKNGLGGRGQPLGHSVRFSHYPFCQAHDT